MGKVMFLLAFLAPLSCFSQEDPGYCGLFGLETGQRDPFWQSGACPAHDKETAANRDGRPYTTNSETALKFIGKTLETGAIEIAEGGFAAVATIPYAILGGGIGFVMWMGRQMIRRRTDEKPRS